MRKFFAGAQSQCAAHAVCISLKDRKTKTKAKRLCAQYIAHNTQKQAVRVYHVDGEIVKDAVTLRCDFILLNDDQKDAYFIELKGSKLLHAIKQIESTQDMAKDSLPGYQFYERIAYSGQTHHVMTFSEIQRRRKRKAKGRPIFRCGGPALEEDIN